MPRRTRSSCTATWPPATTSTATSWPRAGRRCRRRERAPGQLHLARRRPPRRVLLLHRGLELRLDVRHDPRRQAALHEASARVLPGRRARHRAPAPHDVLRLRHPARDQELVPDAPIVYTLHEFMPICHRQGQMLRDDGQRAVHGGVAAALPRVLPRDLPADVLPAQEVHPVAHVARRPVHRPEPVPGRPLHRLGHPRGEDHGRGVRPHPAGRRGDRHAAPAPRPVRLLRPDHPLQGPSRRAEGRGRAARRPTGRSRKTL